MIPFNYHHLYYFYKIAKRGSISKACEELRLAQPTLSSQLKQFESNLNLKLFEREGKKLVLTDEGRYILSYATEIFDTGRELIEGLSDISQKGRLKIQIGVSSFVPRAVVNALLKFLLKIEPGVYMSVQEDKTEVMIENLKKVDYIFLTSNRLYGSIMTYPKKYPTTITYYNALFDGTLGFQKVAEFTSRPHIPIPFIKWCITPPGARYGIVAKPSQECPLDGISFVDDYADETFTVYDHPKVIIFKKIRDVDYRSVLQIKE